MPELPLVGDEFAGYRLRAVLGRGGMSVVFEAEHPRLGNVIALKVLAPELASDDAFRARFLAESRIAASLNHPNVIPIYDTGSSDGLLFIAMRYVSGTDLRQMLKKRGRILPDTALFLLGQAARALDAAHRAGLVHRDVKPGNLLVERAGEEDPEDPDHVYLTDFGITKHALSRSGLTSTGQFLGTIDYVAPEQIRGLSGLGQADQYSLGCVLYECLTGRVPFEKDLDAAIIFAHVEEPPAAPTVLRPDLPPGIDEVFSRVLAKQPGDRYGSCREFITAARAALGSLAGTAGAASAASAAGPAGPAGPDMLGPDGTSTALLPALRPPAPLPALSPAALPVVPPPALPAGVDPPATPVPSTPVPSRAHRGDTIASHRLQPGAGPGPGHGPGPGPGHGPGWPGGGQPYPAGPAAPRRWYLRPPAIAALAALILIAAGGGAWALVHGGSRAPARGMAMSSPSVMPGHKPARKPSPKPPSALENALTLVNQSAGAKGLLPPSTCKQQSAAMVTCTAPALGVTAVTFNTYPSLTALYAAYTAAVKSLNGGSFAENFKDCGVQTTYGEVGWNHEFQHPKNYSVAQMSAGMVTDDKAAGRVFCNYTGGQETMVWTQDDGHLLGAVTGPLHENVWNWWVSVHHNIGFAGSPSMNNM